MCWTGCIKASGQVLTVGGVEQRYGGYYFCPHEGMTLGFSIAASIVVVVLLVAVLRCVLAEKIICKQKFEEEANEGPVAAPVRSCDQRGKRRNVAAIV